VRAGVAGCDSEQSEADLDVSALCHGPERCG
jgi:hypothetical protein